MDTQRIGKWQSQITKLTNEFDSGIEVNQQMFGHYREMIQGRPNFNATEWRFHRWVETNYYVSVLINIRKIFPGDTRGVSLKLIIESMLKAGPTAITKENYIQISPGNGGELDETFRNSTSSTFFDEQGKLDVNKLETDLTTLKEVGKRFKFVSERIAHIDDNPTASLMDDTELDELIAKLRPILLSYQAFLIGQGQGLHYDDAGWTSMFTRAWINR